MAIPSTSLLLATACLIASGCAQPETGEQIVEERFFAMGTWVDVSFVGVEPATAEAALRDVEATLRAFERDFYPWTEGALAELNRAIADGRTATVSEELAELLRRARGLSIASGGLFEPGLGSLVELWGFHTAVLEDREPPSPEAVETALEAAGGIAAIEIDGTRVRSPRRGLKLDLGGIAKGAVVEKILGQLEQYGIDNALVNAGGDLAVTGHQRGGRPWRIGIRDPRADGLLGVLELADGEAAFTSGDYERFFEHEGQRLHHLLDPATGHPVSHTRAVTVISTDAARADAAATALFVAGPQRWRAVASQLGIEAVLRVDTSGAVELTEAMTARLEPARNDHDIIMGSRQELPP